MIGVSFEYHVYVKCEPDTERSFKFDQILGFVCQNKTAELACCTCLKENGHYAESFPLVEGDHKQPLIQLTFFIPPGGHKI